MVWVTFRGMRSHVFKQSYAMAAESRKVPLEIFSNPTILSDDNLFSEFSHFFTPSLFQRGKLISLPFGVFFLPEAGKGRLEGFSKR
jgi:hypothetical protein